MAKFSSFFAIVNIVSENLHYLGNYYSLRKSENGIGTTIKFLITEVSYDLTYGQRFSLQRSPKSKKLF